MTPFTRRATAGAAVVLVLMASTASVRMEARAQQPSRPNVILIVADDMRWDEAGVPTALHETFPAGYLPAIRRELIAKGVAATNAFVVNSLCCPSRASILTGDYSHRTGVWNNQSVVGRGGFAAFRPHEGSTLATWFDAAGYRTALVGKYLNGYNSTGHVPAGWDRWVAFRAGTIGYYSYRLTIDGVERAYGTAPTAYSTDVLADHASAFIRSTPTGTPLFMMFTPYAPHSPFTPAPRHTTLFGSYVPAMPPNVGEADLSDKPSWLRANATGGSGWANQKRNQMRMLMAVDDAVADIIGALTTTGRLSNTVIVFMSDNGLSGGSHRWTTKKSAWDEAIRIPLIVRGPGVQAGVVSEELMLNIDIAATLAEIADVPIPATEGRSLAPVLRGGSTPVHDIFAIERLGDATPPPSYCAVRTMAYKYVRYANGEEELYDLVADPWEMNSRHAAPAYASIKATLLAQTKALCSPPPPGYHF